MTAPAAPGRSPAHLTSRISAATPGAPGQPDRAQPREPRSGELRSALRALMDAKDVRLVTVVGPGGVGKTRLAIELARELVVTASEVA